MSWQKRFSKFVIFILCTLGLITTPDVHMEDTCIYPQSEVTFLCIMTIEIVGIIMVGQQSTSFLGRKGISINCI